MDSHAQLLTRALQVYTWLIMRCQRDPSYRHLANTALPLASATLKQEWPKFLPLEREEIFDHLLEACSQLCGNRTLDISQISAEAHKARVAQHPTVYGDAHQEQMAAYTAITNSVSRIVDSYRRAAAASSMQRGAARTHAETALATATAWRHAFVEASHLQYKVARLGDVALSTFANGLGELDWKFQRYLERGEALPAPTADVFLARAELAAQPTAARFGTFYKLALSFAVLYRTAHSQEDRLKMVDFPQDVMHEEQSNHPFHSLTALQQWHVVTQARDTLYSTCWGCSMHGMLPDATGQIETILWPLRNPESESLDADVRELASLARPQITDRKRRYYRTTTGARGGAF